jgi:methionine aminopeptidase
MHEDPQIPNYGDAGRGPELEEGMVFAIEPMVNAGGPLVRMGEDVLGGLLAGRQPRRAFRVHRRDQRETVLASSRPGTSPTSARPPAA